ncbi:MAG: MFS transporter [Micrococcales bacterium]|nr:MFS transporter [Micrococcales bacterium]
MLSDAPAPASTSNPRQARRAVWAALVGGSLESFDFYVFAYFSALFAPAVFFPPQDRAAGILASFALIGVSYVIRPVGAILFGNIGDRLGRRKTLLLTITIMGVATGLIGVLPGYGQIGIAAPLLLLVLRLAQGLSLGGEWSGGILLAVEHASPRRRGLYAALPQLGSPVGTILVAALTVLLAAVMPADALAAWGWRIPFLLAFPLLLVSLWMRLRIDETPLFRELVTENRRARIPVLAAVTRHPVAILVALGAALLGIGSYSLMNTYLLSYGQTELGFDPQALATATLIGSLVQLVSIPTFGLWADRIGSARIVAIGAAGTLLIAFPMYFLLQFATFPVLVATMIIGGLLPTLAWAGLGGLMADLFSGPIRYSALAIAYAIAATISGFIPLITALLGTATGQAWWHPGVVLAALSALTLGCAILAAQWRRTDNELRTV